MTYIDQSTKRSHEIVEHVSSFQLGSIPAADQNPALIYLASLSSQESRRTMRNALNTVAAILTGAHYDLSTKSWRDGTHDAITMPWHYLRFQHTAAVRATLDALYSPATSNKILSALRQVLETTANLGLMSRDDCATACTFKGIKGESLLTGRELSAGEISALAATCQADDGVGGRRDAALIGVLYTCGLRRSEVVSLDLADFDASNGRLTIRSGKGRKVRTVYVVGGALSALQAWIDVRGVDAGALFARIGKGNRLSVDHLSTQAIYVILKKRGQQAGVADFSPHDMRRTFVGDMLSRGADISTVAKIAGHADVKTTARYDRRPEEAKRQAAGLLHFPFKQE